MPVTATGVGSSRVRALDETGGLESGEYVGLASVLAARDHIDRLVVLKRGDRRVEPHRGSSQRATRARRARRSPTARAAARRGQRSVPAGAPATPPSNPDRRGVRGLRNGSCDGRCVGPARAKRPRRRDGRRADGDHGDAAAARRVRARLRSLRQLPAGPGETPVERAIAARADWRRRRCRLASACGRRQTGLGVSRWRAGR